VAKNNSMQVYLRSMINFSLDRTGSQIYISVLQRDTLSFMSIFLAYISK